MTATANTAPLGERVAAEVRALLRLGGPLLANNLAIAGMALRGHGHGGTARRARPRGRRRRQQPLAARVAARARHAHGPESDHRALRRRRTTPGKVGPYLRQGLWLSQALALLLIAALWPVEPLCVAAGVDPSIIPLTTGYVHAIALGLPGGLAYLALRFVSEGIGRTRPIMYCALTGLAINVALNYVLMFGKLGFPRFGAVGCGIASAIALWCMLAIDALVRARERGVSRATRCSSAGKRRTGVCSVSCSSSACPSAQRSSSRKDCSPLSACSWGRSAPRSSPRTRSPSTTRRTDLHGAARDTLGDDHSRESGDGRGRVRRRAAARLHRHRALRRDHAVLGHRAAPLQRGDRRVLHERSGRARRRREPALHRRHLPGVGRALASAARARCAGSRTRACRCTSISSPTGSSACRSRGGSGSGSGSGRAGCGSGSSPGSRPRPCC